MDKPTLISIGIAAGVVFMVLLTLLPTSEPNIEKAVAFKDLIPEPDPADLQAHIAYCMAPWGQVIGVFFTDVQWQMLHQLSKMSGQNIDELICEIAAQRHAIPDSGEFPSF